MTGHPLGAASAVEAIVCCLALENNYMPVLDDDGDDDDDMYNDFDTMDEKSGWKYIGSREELAQKRKTRKK